MYTIAVENYQILTQNFFDELFSTILSRHDGLKAAYDRPTKSGFSDKELKTGLESLSYLSRKKNLRQITEKELTSLTTHALNICNLDSSKSKEFIDDVNNITCVLKKDGIEFRFIHDSIQEFYAASFIRSQEETKQEFYSKYLYCWNGWIPEINFLKYIDEFAFNKYFLIPSLEGGFFISKDKKLKANRKTFIDSLKSSNCIYYTEKTNQFTDILSINSTEHVENWIVNELLNPANSKNEIYSDTIRSFMHNETIVGFDIKKYLSLNKDSYKLIESNDYSFYIFNLHTLINNLNISEKLFNLITENELEKIQSAYENATSFVNRHNEISGVF